MDTSLYFSFPVVFGLGVKVMPVLIEWAGKNTMEVVLFMS
jgi:hypothetical protein